MTEPTVPVVVQGTEVVVTGFTKDQSGKVREFSTVMPYEHRKARVIYAMGHRCFEYSGEDATGRRIYRDNTKP